jgi:hypothetical protein
MGLIDFQEISDSEEWELFSRDLLVGMGFFIESAPDRGADAGKDLLVSEQLPGRIGNYRYTWLVSCKHYAKSGHAVNEADEPNMLERVEVHRADGFIGFYSTLPSAGLNTRLRALRDRGSIKDYRIFDRELIESYLLRVGFSTLLIRYFPSSYRKVKPLHEVYSEYLPLYCEACGQDILQRLFLGKSGIFAYLKPRKGNRYRYVEDVYWACKGRCDDTLEKEYFERGLITSWQEISEMATPVGFLQYTFALLNDIRGGKRKFSDAAFEKTKNYIYAIAQKALRETDEAERNRMVDLLEMYRLGIR